MTVREAGYDPETDLERSRRAAASHALVSGVHRHVEIPWTPGNVLRLIGVLAVGIGALTGLAQWTVAAYRDEAASRLAVERYFEAIRTGQVQAGFTMNCADEPLVFEEWGTTDVAQALSATSVSDSGVVIGFHTEWRDRFRFHDFEVPGHARGTVQLEATGDRAQPWRVCGVVEAEPLSPA